MGDHLKHFPSTHWIQLSRWTNFSTRRVALFLPPTLMSPIFQCSCGSCTPFPLTLCTTGIISKSSEPCCWCSYQIATHYSYILIDPCLLPIFHALPEILSPPSLYMTTCFKVRKIIDLFNPRTSIIFYLGWYSRLSCIVSQRSTICIYESCWGALVEVCYQVVLA